MIHTLTVFPTEVSVRIRPVSSFALLALLTACEPPAPPVPASLDAVTTPAASLVVATTLATAPSFEVRTASGKPIKNIEFTVAVTQGGGAVTNIPVKTVAGGPTSIGTWTLGTSAGAQTVTVTVEDLPVLVFNTTATAAAPAALEMVSGNNQRTGESTQIPLPIQVMVEDTHGNAVAGVTVNWAVTLGGGSVAAPTSVTNSVGVATAPAWTLGLESAGAQQLSATMGAFTVNFGAVVQEPAASITVETAAPATVAAGTLIATAPTFVVRDAGGLALNGVPVSITVTSGGGSIANKALQSGPTPTSIGNWTVGTGLGAQTVTIQVTGIPNAVISTTTVAGPPSVMDIVEGDDQDALAGTVLGAPIRVRVEDSFGNPVAGGTVNWSVLSGGGVLAGPTSVPNASGIATAPAWTLGLTFAPQLMRAQRGSAVADISATITSDYALTVVYPVAPPSQAIQDAFNNAVNRLKAIIVGELSQVQFPPSFNATACVAGLFINNELIPGLRIYASIEAIDGVGGTLGSAGPCYTRSSNTLPVVGRMRFDVADVENMVTNGSIESVILHEMLHVIGVGTIWSSLGLRPNTAPSGTPIFLGALAKTACIDDHAGATVCSAGVPAEDCLNLTQSCGGGTINSHWKESVFRTELMTGFLNAGTNPFSRMTIQSLADMGYTVNTLPNDAYTVPPPSLMSNIPAFSQRMGEPRGPIASVDEKGQIVHVFPPQLDR